MKKFLNVISWVLALNFLLVAAAIVALFASHKLDKEKAQAIKSIVFPATAPATQPAVLGEEPTTRPGAKLEALLAQASGRPANEQVEFMQQSFDSQMAVLDRRERELRDLARQVELARQQVGQDRTSLSAEEKTLAETQAKARIDEQDKGFQDALKLYSSLPAKQVKSIFLALDDEKVVRFLQSMPTRTANKILKECKTPEETQRVQKWMDRLQAGGQASTKEPAG